MLSWWSSRNNLISRMAVKFTPEDALLEPAGTVKGPMVLIATSSPLSLSLLGGVEEEEEEEDACLFRRAR